MTKIDIDLPARRGPQHGEVAERQASRAKPPSAVLAHHLGAYVAMRRTPQKALHHFLDRLRDVPPIDATGAPSGCTRPRRLLQSCAPPSSSTL